MCGGATVAHLFAVYRVTTPERLTYTRETCIMSPGPCPGSESEISIMSRDPSMPPDPNWFNETRRAATVQRSDGA